MDTNNSKRTIGFHPCVGKKATGEERPTTVVIRTPDGKHVEHEFGEQELLDFFTCGAAVGWRDAKPGDLAVARPPHHARWGESSQKEYDEYLALDPAERESELKRLFSVKRKKSTGEVTSYFRLQVPSELAVLNPATDIVGVANGGLGYQIVDILLGRHSEMDVRTIGSGTLKEHRSELDQLLPSSLRKKAEKMRAKARGQTPGERRGADGRGARRAPRSGREGRLFQAISDGLRDARWVAHPRCWFTRPALFRNDVWR